MFHVTEKMVAYFGCDVRRISHALKVLGFARVLAEETGVSEKENLIIELAAVLHDIGIHEAERKHNSSAGKYQELEGPPIAESILSECGVPKDVSARVSYLVGHHHSYGMIDGIDFQILVEADFLVNIAEDAMEHPAIQSIRDKYFKTQAGIKILDSMYLSEK